MLVRHPFRLFRSERDRFAEAYVREMTQLVAAIDGASVRVAARDGIPWLIERMFWVAQAMGKA